MFEGALERIVALWSSFYGGGDSDELLAWSFKVERFEKGVKMPLVMMQR